jgi:putative ubiquitin-RnfH superfamily antitoxin RatB of RatAB toxin-antitoxin module
MPDVLRVSVVRADPERQFVRELRLPAGATVADAIAACGSLPGVDANPTRFGIFGRVVDAGATLRDGDRVEIYRALKIDPMEARRRRATRK